MVGPDPADDADVRRAIGGDREAFGALVARHARRVHDLARRMLKDPVEAEDVAQQAFWNAWRAMPRFDPERPFRHWILRITTNLCRNRWVARGRSPERVVGGDETPPDPAAPPAPLHESGLESSVAAGRVREAVAALPETLRLAAVLRYVHDLSLEAIAEITDEPLGTVKTHLHRARAALRGLLDEDETSGDARGTSGGRP